MNYYTAVIVLIGGIVFLFLPPRYKAFLALFTMTACFNLVPRIINNVIDVWDIGAVMLMITGVHLCFTKPKTEPIQTDYLFILKIFIVWLWFSLLWGIVVYQYPVLNTLKTSRHMIIGYMSVFVFLRLFRVDKDSFDFVWKALYWTTFVFMLASIVQYPLNIQLLYLSERKYGAVIRRLPLFLPFCLMHFWVIVAKLNAGEKTRLHEKLYILITIFVIITTYIRGVYLAVLIMFGVMLIVLILQRKLKLKPVVASLGVLIIIGSVFFVAGYLDRVIDRFSSGIQLVLLRQELDLSSRRKLDDSYTGRMGIVRERFDLVVKKNPLFGYAFIHESDVPPMITHSLRYGSVSYSDQLKKQYATGSRYVLALHSADAGWANIFLDVGIIGFLLFVAFMCSISFDFFKRNISDKNKYYFVRVGLFLQLFTLVLLMFNGNPYTWNVQIPAFMIAGYAFINSTEKYQNNIKQDHEKEC